MKKLIVLAAAAALLSGCAAVQSVLGPTPGADQNLSNVEQIVSENEAYLAADPKPASLKAAQHDRNQAAVELAKKMAGK